MARNNSTDWTSINWPPADWSKIAFDSYSLWSDAMWVVGLRTTDMMTGRNSARESMLMVTEKMEAGAELATKLTFGAMRGDITSPEQGASMAVKHYGKKVRANRKRLVAKRRG